MGKLFNREHGLMNVGMREMSSWANQTQDHEKCL